MKGLLALALVACGSGTPAPSAPLKGTFVPAKVAPPATPAPWIAYADDRFDLHGFPAITRDGSVVALPLSNSDGGRGYPDLRIELRLHSDKTFETLPVMSSDEYEALVTSGAATPALVRRIDKANARLRELHAQSDLVPMLRAEELDHATEFVFHGLYEVRYTGGMIKLVFDADHSISFDHADWRAPKGPACVGCTPCENPEYLKAVYYAEGINAIVVEFGYQGTDICWEPGNQLHVLTW